MDAITLFEKLLSDIHYVLHSAVDDLTEQEWKVRPAPGQNLIGFTVWHIPRIQDNIIQTWIRNIPELAHGERWADWQQLRHLGSGAGITLEEADEIARTVQKGDVLAYADEVHQEVLAWLRELSDDDLDRIPDAEKHLSPHAEYQTPGYHEEADSLLGQPIWGLLMYPCIRHVQQHLGELMLVKEVFRASK